MPPYQQTANQLNRQFSLDAYTVSILADAVNKLSAFMDEKLTTSAIVRLAIEELGSFVAVVDELGEPDKADLRSKIREAMRCRPARVQMQPEEATK